MTFAMRKLKEQLKLAKDKDYNDGEACSGSFTATFGMPCKHYLHYKIYEQRDFTGNDKATFIIKLNLIDQYWWLDLPRAKGEVFEHDKDLFRPIDPLKIRCKGRPRGATTKTLRKPKNGHKRNQCEPRDPSGFEHIIATQQLSPETPQASEPRRKRVYRKKTTTTVVEESEGPAPVMTTEMAEALRAMMREEMAMIKEQMDELKQRQE
tara:strand:- start:563 stop:1186 length:624 start_codon:yes stop_codon:yes gene_type:complete